jgi:phage I-like protein
MKSYKTLKIKQKENNSIILKKELTMDLKKQILVALGLDKQDEVALEYQAKLEDGTLIVSTSTNLEAGVDISVLTEDGSTMLLPIGEYKTEEGQRFKVEKEGVVAELYEDEVEKETEGEPVNEEMEDDGKEADVDDWAGMEKRIKNLEDAVADLKKDKVGNDEVEESDVEMDSETKATPKKVKTTEEIEFEYQAKIEELKSKVVELSNQPADTPVDTNKFSTDKKDSTPDLRKMTKRERILYNLTNN